MLQMLMLASLLLDIGSISLPILGLANEVCVSLVARGLARGSWPGVEGFKDRRDPDCWLLLDT